MEGSQAIFALGLFGFVLLLWWFLFCFDLCFIKLSDCDCAISSQLRDCMTSDSCDAYLEICRKKNNSKAWIRNEFLNHTGEKKKLL